MDILHRMPELFQGAVFQKLASIADVTSLTKEERIQYDASLRHYRDTIAVMEGQYQEGRAEGLAEGRAEGRAEERRDNARKMKDEGMSAELIAKYTGFTVEEISVL